MSFDVVKSIAQVDIVLLSYHFTYCLHKLLLLLLFIFVFYKFTLNVLSALRSGLGFVSIANHALSRCYSSFRVHLITIVIQSIFFSWKYIKVIFLFLRFIFYTNTSKQSENIKKINFKQRTKFTKKIIFFQNRFTSY